MTSLKRDSDAMECVESPSITSQPLSVRGASVPPCPGTRLHFVKSTCSLSKGSVRLPCSIAGPVRIRSKTTSSHMDFPLKVLLSLMVAESARGGTETVSRKRIQPAVGLSVWITDRAGSVKTGCCPSWNSTTASSGTAWSGGLLEYCPQAVRR